MATARFSTNTEFNGCLAKLNIPYSSQPKSNPIKTLSCVQAPKCSSEDGSIRFSVKPRGFGRIGSASSLPKRNFCVEAKEGLTYKDAGVDIDAGTELVRRIAKMAPGIGGFGGLFPLGLFILWHPFLNLSL